MEMPLVDNFIENLQAACEKRGLSQRELARLSGVHYVTVNRIFQRQTDPSLSTCELLAEAAGMIPEKSFAETRKAC